ncbi:MAG: monovalent cation/H+ antiporter complex subunit F [Deltaproteobacteria bacterium]|jgi:multicomponent Na+:H+ antiporter subunit F|nr:pH regulation protein F [Deltaproteobacteria bacterium]MDL1980860.1 monovalent cation/H+ antiporter complex subunit F [Deltaproteobacteria bacterium]MDL1987267.1 monovalent cation/H+ antiporter complex subunit F [Deltaproteobacteria bacterium]
MENFYLGVSIFLCFLVLLCLYRVVCGPTIIDRIVGVGAIGTKTLVVLVLMGFIYGRIEMFLDIIMVYAILNFIGTLAAAKYFEGRGEI